MAMRDVDAVLAWSMSRVGLCDLPVQVKWLAGDYRDGFAQHIRAVISVMPIDEEYEEE